MKTKLTDLTLSELLKKQHMRSYIQPESGYTYDEITEEINLRLNRL